MDVGRGGRGAGDCEAGEDQNRHMASHVIFPGPLAAPSASSGRKRGRKAGPSIVSELAGFVIRSKGRREALTGFE
jgi:hypothetical protein